VFRKKDAKRKGGGKRSGQNYAGGIKNLFQREGAEENIKLPLAVKKGPRTLIVKGTGELSLHWGKVSIDRLGKLPLPAQKGERPPKWKNEWKSWKEGRNLKSRIRLVILLRGKNLATGQGRTTPTTGGCGYIDQLLKGNHEFNAGHL